MKAECSQYVSSWNGSVMEVPVASAFPMVMYEEARVSHEALAQETEDAFGDPKKLGLNLSAENLEPCYSPIIQSGGAYNLKPSAYSNNANLASGGTITLSLGARFKSYCSNVEIGRAHV